MENDDILVSIKTEKISGKLAIHIPSYFHVLTVHEVIMRMNQLKGIYFPEVRKIVDLLLSHTSGTIPPCKVYA